MTSYDYFFDFYYPLLYYQPCIITFKLGENIIVTFSIIVKGATSMRRSISEMKYLLHCILVLNLIALIPIFLRKPPIKDWVIVYLFNAVTNIYTDKFLTYFKIVRYPIRFSQEYYTRTFYLIY